MPIPQRALSLGLAAMRRLNSAWGRLTTLRKVIVVSIAVMTALVALKNDFDLFTVLVLSCAMLLLLIFIYLSPGDQKVEITPLQLRENENMRVATVFGIPFQRRDFIGLFKVGFLYFLVVGFIYFMAKLPEPSHAELNEEMQEVRIERDKVRIGMTINDVLPLVHGMDITAQAAGDYLSVLPDNRRFYYSPPILDIRSQARQDALYAYPKEKSIASQNANGTFAVSCYCGTEQVSRNEKVSESKAAALLMWKREEQVVQNLTASQAAELMRQKMSDGFDWSWQYKTFKGSGQYVFTVTFGRDGRVNHISDVYYTDLRHEGVR